MTLPAALTLIPLHGRILRTDAAGTPAVGTVSFRIEQTLRDTTDHVLLTPTTLTATLDATGSFIISLPATNDPDVTPLGWTYVVTVATDALADTWRISVPVATAGTLEFADIAPATSPSSLVTYVLASAVGQIGGPAGPLDGSGLIPVAQVPGASPSSTVTAETSYGLASSPGVAGTLSRGDHTHGSPVKDAGDALRQAMTPAGRTETRSRLDSGVASTVIVSGTIYLVPIWLTSGQVVSSISFVSGTTAATTPAHQWFALLDGGRALLATTTNDLTTAWAASAKKTLGVAQVAAGAASSFTATFTGVHYLGLMVAAATPPTILGGGGPGAQAANDAPAFGGANSGLTTPPAFPFTANAPSVGGPLAYAYTS